MGFFLLHMLLLINTIVFKGKRIHFIKLWNEEAEKCLILISFLSFIPHILNFSFRYGFEFTFKSKLFRDNLKKLDIDAKKKEMVTSTIVKEEGLKKMIRQIRY